MSRLLSLLLALILPVSAALAAVDIPDPASLPEKKSHGDSDPTYPAECARRLLAGKAFLEAGDLDKAREEFAKAEKADDGEPWVFFYKAILDYRLGDYPTALSRAQTGIGTVTDIFTYGNPNDNTKAQMARFTELRDAIQAKLTATGGKAAPNPLEQKQKFEAALKEGDEAYAKGLLAKAAGAYERAYRADSTQAEIGLRAASLYADRLKKPLDAAILWQLVLAGGEPHATTVRAELQSHHDILDAILKEALSRRAQWRTSGDPTEALRYAAAFPDNTELQVELAILFARKGNLDAVIEHLQAASRLGMSADEFLGQPDFTNYLAQGGGLEGAAGQRIGAFVRDAYGEETVTAIRTELKRRADETARLAREKAEQERQAKLAAERKELTTWRDARRSEAVQAVNVLISARNGIEVEMADVQSGKKRTHQFTMLRNNSLFFGNGKYVFTFWQRATLVRLSNGVAAPTSKEELISLPSFALFRSLEVWPSSWEREPARIGDAGSAPYSLPADPGYRALCKEVRLNFNNPANIHRQETMRYEYETSDGSTGYTNHSDYDSAVLMPVMLQNEEVARLKSLFEKLARLDAAGTDVEKLRALRINWNAWN